MRNADSRYAALRKAAWRLAVLVVAAAGLTVSSVASASVGVVGFEVFGYPAVSALPKDGEFNGLSDTAVNHSGVGGVSPGDYYVLGNGVASGPGSEPGGGPKVERYSATGTLKQVFYLRGNGGEIDVDQATGDLIIGGGSSVEVHSATGTFLRRFGRDAVKSGPGDSNVNAKYKLIVIAAGGTFVVTARKAGVNPPQTLFSAPIPYNASTTVVKDAVDDLLELALMDATVTVTGGPGDAIGSSPYEIEFTGGTMAGDEGPRTFEFGTDPANLTGTTKRATMERTVVGGAVEMCLPADVCGSRGFRDQIDVAGAFGSISDVTLAPPGAPNAGNVLVAEAEFRRISEVTTGGTFLRTTGWDVVRKGPNDSSTDAQQQVTANATGGKFSITFQETAEGESRNESTTGAAGNGDLTSGSVTVNNVSTRKGAFAVGEAITGTGIPSGTTIEAIGVGTLTLSAAANQNRTSQNLVGSDIPFNASPAQVEAALNALPTIGGLGASVTVTGTNPYTVTFHGTLGGDDISPGLSTSSEVPANAGLTGGAQTVTFTQVTRGGGFETCVAADGDECKSPLTTTGPGSEAIPSASPTLAEDSTGALYVGETNVNFASTSRMRKLTPAGSKYTTSWFGTDEVQELSVNATAGQFRLGFGSKEEGAKAKATVTEGSNKVTNVLLLEGDFTVGEKIEPSGGGSYLFQENTQITAVGPGNTLTLSKPAREGGSNLDIRSTSPYLTGDLPFNASAAAVQTALNGLSPISSNGGAVTVTGGPAPAPYTVTFGGRMNVTGVKPIVFRNGTTPLSGGAGPGANAVTVTTVDDGGPGGSERGVGPLGVVVDNEDHVVVLREFPINEETCGNGVASLSEARVELFSQAGALESLGAYCLELNTEQQKSFSQPDINVDPVNGEIYYTGGEGGTTKFPVPGGGFLRNRIFVLGELGPVPTLSLNAPSNFTPTSATVSGEITPFGPALANTHGHPTKVKVRIEVKKTTDTDWLLYAADSPVGNGNSPVPFSTAVSSLTPKTEYEVRITAEKIGEPPVSQVQTIKTLAGPPAIDALSSSNVTPSSADLHAVINPLAEETTYHFEYGPTPDYGFETPEVPIGNALGQVTVQDHIEDLDAVVYHFRVVATNPAGTSKSADQTFNFYPESCPNRTARQQTGSDTLPDCRAYELVTPANAKGVLLAAGGAAAPYATSPSRLSFVANFGVLDGPWVAPEALAGDRYVATRTTSGWSYAYSGIEGTSRTAATTAPYFVDGAAYVDRGMSRLLEWDPGPVGFFLTGENLSKGSAAPFMTDALGNNLGRLPTNAGEVEGGLNDVLDGGWVGQSRPSEDFSHFFFSSANVAFAPGGLTSNGGSVYDNDLVTGTVTIASKKANGEPIPNEPGDLSDDFKELPAVSADGSHVLISAPEVGVCGVSECQPAPNVCSPATGNGFGCKGDVPSHLYMRVGGSLTYDVSMEHAVRFVGMTTDGEQVFFTTDEQLVDDHDEGVDLYEWREATDSVKRISDGPGLIGDTDACNAEDEWIANCGVEMIELGGGYHGSNLPGFSETPSQLNTATDNYLAANSGDIFFTSPELFDPTKGLPNRRNLYVYRNGGVQFVTTLEVANPLKRIQVSPDGLHAAFLTASKLTSYDNTAPDGVCSRDDPGPGLEGVPGPEPATSGPRCLEMYSYDVELRELVCVSCPASLEPPTRNTQGSQNGLFMSDDGRVFFATNHALVPYDTNGVVDSYEYVSGKPRLLSSGTDTRFKTGRFGEAGFVGVSASGVDAYFSTYQGLVAEDQNGQYLRIYDARTGGGFATATAAAPCAAAEECRAPAGPAAPAPTITSTADLGAGGNAKTATKGKKKSKTHKRKTKKSKRKAKHRRSASRKGRNDG